MNTAALKTAVGATTALASSVFLISRNTMPRSSQAQEHDRPDLLKPRGQPQPVNNVHTPLKVLADEYPVRWTIAYMP
jgi:hypothetical protein